MARLRIRVARTNGCEIMVLAVRDGHETRYFVLSRDRDGAISTYSIGRWSAGCTESIQITDDSEVPGVCRRRKAMEAWLPAWWTLTDFSSMTS